MKYKNLFERTRVYVCVCINVIIACHLLWLLYFLIEIYESVDWEEQAIERERAKKHSNIYCVIVLWLRWFGLIKKRLRSIFCRIKFIIRNDKFRVIFARHTIYRNTWQGHELHTGFSIRVLPKTKRNIATSPNARRMVIISWWFRLFVACFGRCCISARKLIFYCCLNSSLFYI